MEVENTIGSPKPKQKKIVVKKIVLFFFLLLTVIGGIFGGYKLGLNKKITSSNTEVQSQNIYISFVSEVYDLVNENYWDKVDEEKLVSHFSLATEKVGGVYLDSQPKNKEELFKTLSSLLGKVDSEDKKKKFTSTLADTVLSNLQPLGRSRLYSQKEEQNLSNLVQNINPEVNQYQVLGLDKEATDEEIQKAYESQSEKLKKEASPEAKQKLAQIEKAYQTLGDTTSKENYDASGVETTLESKLVKPSILYLHLTRFSPTTFDDIKRVTEKFDEGSILDTLILDLRDNIGGAFDGLPYFLGPFIGNNKYAYQLFHKGENTDYKTKIGYLPSLLRYKKVIILINENSQSTAETMVSVLKKYNVGILVGTKSKGWGTIEKVFPLNTQIDKEEKYSILLVHSLSLREDDKPIEGNGVEPVIDISAPNWEKELFSYFNSQEIVDTVKELI